MTTMQLSSLFSVMQSELAERLSVSLFTKGIVNTIPEEKPVSFAQVLLWVATSERLKEYTERYRATLDPNIKKKLPYITPAGVFAVREEKGLVMPSHLFCIDIDKVPAGTAKHPVTGDEIDYVELIKYNIMNDERICAIAAMRSPSGNGIKAFIWQPIPPSLSTLFAYPEMHRALDVYIEKLHVAKYGGIVDKKCCDVARAAFLCHDPNVLIRKGCAQ